MAIKISKKNLPVKIASFLMVMFSTFAAVTSALCLVFAFKAGFYGDSLPEDVIMDVGQSLVEDAARKVEFFINTKASATQIRTYFSSGNMDVEVWRKGAVLPIWGTYDGSYTTDMVKDVELNIKPTERPAYLGGYVLAASKAHFCRIYIDSSFPHEDRFSRLYQDVTMLYEMRYAWIGLTAGVGTIAILCFMFFLSIILHETKEASPENSHSRGKIGRILLTALGIGVIVCVEQMLENMAGKEHLLSATVLKGGAITLIFSGLCWGWFRSGMSGRRIVPNKLMSVLIKPLKLLGQKYCALWEKVPLVVTFLVIFLGISLLELSIWLFFVRTVSILLWILEKLVMLPIVVYLAICCKRFMLASKALAQGMQDYTVNTSLMVGGLKRHGENLNSIGQGISKAVEARTKSERMKTELITNVSHDLKTPLTSIINYSKLISEQKTENQTVTEYSQVLLRQSERLKKLLEDLVEASKATTGNLELHMVPCEVGVLLSQAVGEYQKRLEEKGLELRTTQPEEQLRIMADGRYLWRVFDNLLNNICKYAQEGSRVYLNVERNEEQIQIVFRNMSKYPLNISAEELEERFVRGDKSRHMEGNGLGLPIAKSLVELQNGRMEIWIDGDLFKVTLSFEQLEEQSSAGS